jgi:hypothetical protein
LPLTSSTAAVSVASPSPDETNVWLWMASDASVVARAPRSKAFGYENTSNGFSSVAPKTRTRRSASGTGSGRISRPLTTEKTAVLPPTPIASVTIVTTASAGLFKVTRMA